MNKSTKIGLKREYDIHIENCPSQELDKALLMFCVEMCKYVMLIMNLIKHALLLAQQEINRTRDARNWARAGDSSNDGKIFRRRSQHQSSIALAIA